MRCFPFFSSALVLVAVMGCASTPATRISRNETVLSSWPSAVQEKIRAGKIDLGFTSEQVRMALGAPDRTSSRTTPDGTSESWAYLDHKTKFGFGLGFGWGGRSSAVAVGVGPNEFRNDERLHVIFERGRVSAIETAKNE